MSRWSDIGSFKIGLEYPLKINLYIPPLIIYGRIQQSCLRISQKSCLEVDTPRNNSRRRWKLPLVMKWDSFATPTAQLDSDNCTRCSSAMIQTTRRSSIAILINFLVLVLGRVLIFLALVKSCSHATRANRRQNAHVVLTPRYHPQQQRIEERARLNHTKASSKPWRWRTNIRDHGL
jgi:hypothetical protein